MEIKKITPESIREDYARLRQEHGYCSHCGSTMRLLMDTEFRFDKKTGRKTPYYTVHSWVCSQWSGWKQPIEWEGYNPHNRECLGGLLGGPVL